LQKGSNKNFSQKVTVKKANCEKLRVKSTLQAVGFSFIRTGSFYQSEKSLFLPFMTIEAVFSRNNLKTFLSS
jgi:hypothetical protein